MTYTRFTVKVVKGGTPGTTAYGSEVVTTSEDQAIKLALMVGGTKDVFEGERKLCRVHADGGVDFE